MAANVLAWLDARAEPLPPALRARLAEALAEVAPPPAHAGHAAPVTPRGIHETLLVAGEAMLARLLNHNRTTREAALDLLAADALVTYAFEAAAEDGVGIAERARKAMVQIAALGG
jgi:hypothetical protein